jgi:Helix-turn-helix domain
MPKAQIAPVAQQYFTTREAAAYLRLSQSNLAKRRLTGDTPQYIKIGRKVLYAREALDRFFQTRTRRSTSDQGERDGTAG